MNTSHIATSAPQAELCYEPATALVERMRRKDISARDVLQAHLARIEATNPTVNAIVTMPDPEDLLREAAALDDRWAAGEWGGALHGLPLTQKDTTPTKGLRTTYGSPLFRDHIPDFDPLVVQRCQSAGSVMIGKSNTPEFAAGSHTFNPVFGATRNPYDIGRSSGGSSGGAAAALASGMCALACGSDMGGSVRNPAAWNNVVGLRPSPGRIPRVPDRNLWNTLGVDGPMARTVADVALLLSVLAGPSAQTPTSIESPGTVFGGSLDRDFKGARVAVFAGDANGIAFDPEIRAAVEQQIEIFEQLGCIVERADPDLRLAEDVFRIERAILMGAAASSLGHENRNSMKAEVLSEWDLLERLTGKQIAAMYERKSRIFAAMSHFLQNYEYYVLPVTQVSPFAVEMDWPRSVNGATCSTYIDWMRSCWYISATEHPALSVPCGFTAGGLPIGMQVVGRHRAELSLLQFGHAFENATRYGRKHPAI